MINSEIELLAPAGALPQLEAAVRCGADAVYFGTSVFNARRNAANFSNEDFISAVKYCHIAGVKCYITLNTLVTDDEAKQLRETLELVVRSGVDAVIVQDAAVAKAIFECCPTMPVHASTQMAIHNVAGARALERLGFSRVVTARELSIKEIAKIASSVNIEIEAFVHGASCMSASGMCYLSSTFGARSGNRGLCAQPCRLNFKADGREFALSLKDMCLIEHINELKAAGVASLKIEGRMKRPEYVAAAVTEYKKAIDGENYNPTTLRNVFSRSGFTDGYAIAKRDISMFGHRTKEDVTAANDVLKAIEGTYRQERRSVGISMKLTVTNGKRSVLSLTDGKNTVKADGDVPEKAINVALSAERAEKSLLKLGGTVYFCEKFEAEIEDGLSLSAASLNEMRRNAIELLSQKRSEKTHELLPEKERPLLTTHRAEKPSLRLQFRKAEQIPNDLECEKLILPLSEINKHQSLIKSYPDTLCAAIPTLIYPENEEKTENTLKSLSKAGLKYALCENIGAIQLAKDCGLEILGGAILNITNSDAAEAYYKNGVRDITLSTELSFDLISRLRTRAKIGFIAYGHMPLMHFRCCPMRSPSGCGSCTGKGVLKDRKNESFTVLCNEKNFSTLHNPIPLYTGDMKMPPVDHVTLMFTLEEKEDCQAVIKLFNAGKSLSGRKTTGLYNKKLF